MAPKPLSLGLRAAAALLPLVAAPACGLLRATAEAPGRVVGAALPSKDEPRPDPELLQQRVLRLALELIARDIMGIDAFERLSQEPDARVRALRWKIATTDAVTSFATQANAYFAVADLVATVSLTRMALERHWTKTPDGAAFEPWLTACRDVEAAAWDFAGEIANQEAVESGRRAIEDYFESRDDAAVTALDHPDQMVVRMRGTLHDGKSGSGLLAMLSLDPFSGLDPAVREISQSRMLGERAVFALQQTPRMLQWRVELMTIQTLERPQVDQMLASTAQLTASVERITAVAEALPDRVASEREQLVAALEEQEGSLGRLSADLERTLEAGTAFSDSLNTTLGAVDGLVQRFGVGEPVSEPEPGSAPAPAPDDGEPARPFDILDYARTADSLTRTTRELNTLVGSIQGTVDSEAWEDRLREVERLSALARADGEALLDRAFGYGAALIGIALLAALAYRAALRRMPRHPTG